VELFLQSFFFTKANFFSPRANLFLAFSDFLPVEKKLTEVAGSEFCHWKWSRRCPNLLVMSKFVKDLPKFVKL